MTPSSAATTRMTMSVTLAPRARIIVNASWPGRIQEHHAAAVDVDRVRTDVLRNAARFAFGDLGLTDRVEQGRLAMIDVTHDRDDRRAWREISGARRFRLDFRQLLFEAAA
jgi:hypothetical protein